jgi:hypothetical protein
MVHSEDGHEDSGKTNTAQTAAASTGHAALSTPATWCHSKCDTTLLSSDVPPCLSNTLCIFDCCTHGLRRTELK